MFSASLTRRATAAAIIVSVGTTGGAVAGQIYRAEHKPKYFLGHTVSFVCVVLQSILIIVLRLILMKINCKRQRMDDKQMKEQIEKYGGEKLAGDHHPKFRYIL